MEIKKIFAAILFVAATFITNISMAFAFYPGMGYANCGTCGSLITPINTTNSPDYTQFYSCNPIDGVTSLTGKRYYKKNLLVAQNEKGYLCITCLEKLVTAAGGTIKIDADYSITVPESVQLTSNDTGTGTYTGSITVTAAGEVPTDQHLYLYTSYPVMTRTGSQDREASISSASSTCWSRAEVADGSAVSKYDVSASLTPGDWRGTLIFYAGVSQPVEMEIGENDNCLVDPDEDISKIKFEITDSSIATINDAGYVIPAKNGIATVTKTVYDDTGTKVSYIRLYEIEVGQISETAATMITTRLIPALTDKSWWWGWGMSNNITELAFGSYTVPSGTSTYDVSGRGDKSIVAFVDGNTLKVTNADGSPLIFADGNSLSFNQNSAFNNITSVKYENVKTPLVTSLNGAFKGMTKLTSITGISNWNTTKVTDMNSMFSGCTSLTSVDINGWNTRNVTDFGSMFAGCTSLTDVTVGINFGTSNLPTAGSSNGMFYINSYTKSAININGKVSDALKAYDFTADNRTAQFASTASYSVEQPNDFAIVQPASLDSRMIRVATPETAQTSSEDSSEVEIDFDAKSDG